MAKIIRSPLSVMEKIYANSFGFGRCPVCGRGEKHGTPRTVIEGMFEVHHIIPVSEIKNETVPPNINVILLCPTCHRAVHYVKKMRGWDSLQAIMANLESLFNQKQIERIASMSSVNTADQLYVFREWLRDNGIGDDEEC